MTAPGGPIGGDAKDLWSFDGSRWVTSRPLRAGDASPDGWQAWNGSAWVTSRRRARPSRRWWPFWLVMAAGAVASMLVVYLSGGGIDGFGRGGGVLVFLPGVGALSLALAMRSWPSRLARAARIAATVLAVICLLGACAVVVGLHSLPENL